MKSRESWDWELFTWMVWIGSSLVILLDHLILTYLVLQLQTFSAFILIASWTTSIKSGEGALKYFILGAVSSGLSLLSLETIYYFHGELTISALNSINYYDQHKYKPIFYCCLCFLSYHFFPFIFEFRIFMKHVLTALWQL